MIEFLDPDSSTHLGSALWNKICTERRLCVILKAILCPWKSRWVFILVLFWVFCFKHQTLANAHFPLSHYIILVANIYLMFTLCRCPAKHFTAHFFCQTALRGSINTISPICQCRLWSIERLVKLPKVTELGSDGSGFEFGSVWLQQAASLREVRHTFGQSFSGELRSVCCGPDTILGAWDSATNGTISALVELT